MVAPLFKLKSAYSEHPTLIYHVTLYLPRYLILTEHNDTEKIGAYYSSSGSFYSILLILDLGESDRE